jgi:SAM-dependent methyltransferase
MLVEERFASKINENDPDFDGLDQGKFSTNLRHEKALSVWKGGSLLDIGCGTGLILEKLNPLPDEYFGVDIIPDRVRYLTDRVLNLKMNTFSISIIEKLKAFDGLYSYIEDHPDVDSIFIMGVVGYSCCNVKQDLEDLIEASTFKAPRGCITVPVRTETFQGHDWLYAFYMDDLEWIVSDLKSQLRIIPTKTNNEEIAIIWNHFEHSDHS